MAAAHALADALRATGGVEVVERDGLRAFGRVLRHVIRDGYRWQLHTAPWSYDALYWLVTHLRPARAICATVLAVAGRRRLGRIVRREAPDVAVSTHPALTCVLGHLRLRRRLDVPLCATITDFADYDIWAHPGADRHLVMHQHAVGPVERLAGADSATLVGPLVAAGFRAGTERATARARLGLPLDDRVVAVSGGGWGVGDLAGAIDAALAIDGTTVVALAGRNDALRAGLRTRFAGDARVRVWGFTDRMADLLRAADVAIHSTGGMTSLEALACGCPMIAYGSSIGHIRVHNRTMAALGLLTVAGTRAELAAALRRQPTGAPPLPAGVSPCDPAAAVIGVRSRVRPLPRWRIAAGHALAPVLAVVLLLVGLSNDGAYSLAARPLELRPVTHVATGRPDVAVVLRARPAAVAGLARALAAGGVHATFAVSAPPAPALRRTLAGLGDDTLPELGAGGAVRWLRTRGELRGMARLGTHRRYLVPASGLGLGQYLLGRSADASPVAGRESFDASRPPSASASAGDIVVVDVDGSPGQAFAVVGRLRAAGLRAVSLSTLLSPSTSERTAGAVVSTTAPPTTTARPPRIPAGPSGA